MADFVEEGERQHVVPADNGGKNAHIETARRLKKISDIAGAGHPHYRDWFLKRAFEHLRAAHEDTD